MSKNGNRAIMDMLHKEARYYYFDERLEIYVMYVASLYRKRSNPGKQTFLEYAKEIYW